MTRRLLGTLAIALASPVVFLGLLEAIAWAAGVRPLAEDPEHQIREELRRCRSDPAHLDRCDATRWRERADAVRAVFTLGASSMRGHPFGEKRNIPHFLRRHLEDRRPGAYRVFDVARPCKDSIYVVRCTQRLLDAAPDVLVVYAGHNDFAAFTGREPRIPIWLARSGAWIEGLARGFARLRIASLLARRGSEPLGPVEEKAPPLDGAALVRAQRIVLDHYAGNLERVIALAGERGVAVVLVTLVSNLEFPVPRERWDDVLARAGEEEGDAWLRAYADGVDAFRAGRYQAALERFKLARDARPYTRAPGLVNERLREIAARHDHVRLVDFERELDRVGASEGIGCNFFGTDEYCDGVHPNPRTSALLGAAIADAVLALPGRQESDPGFGSSPRALCPECNVVLISLDALRADHLGLYGYERDTSPRLERLAQTSVVFENAIAQYASTTHSHRALFSGRYPFRGDESPTLAELLRGNDWQTGGITGGRYIHSSLGFDRGFDSYDDELRSFTSAQLSLEETMPRILHWLDSREPGPFLLFVHTYDIHCPYDPPEPYASMFPAPGDSDLDTERCGHGRGPFSAADRAKLAAAYDGSIRWVDASLGRLFDELERRGLLEETIVVVTSDHGESLGERGFVGHGRLNEEQLRVPLVIRVPGLAPHRSAEPVQLVDVLPTLAAALGLEAPPGLDGDDLAPILRGGRPYGGRRLRLSQADGGRWAVRTDDRWKLLVHRDGSRALVDMRLGTRDVSARHVDEVERLQHALDDLVGDREYAPRSR